MVNPLYAYYWFSTEQMSKYINLQNTGSTIPLINLTVLKGLPIPVPPIEIQNKIVSIIEDIDSKLSINMEINEQSTAWITSLFKSWFVDYEPYEGSMPEDWSKGVLKDLLTLIKKGIKPGEYKDIPYLPIDLIPMHQLAIQEVRPNEDAQSSLLKFDRNDILIGAMRVYFHRVAIAPFDGITRSTCFVLRPKKTDYLAYALLCCNEEKSINYAQSTSKGTTMPYAIWDNGLGDMDIVIPDINTAKRFNEICMPFIEKIRDSFYENSRLKELQNTLIPRLLMGQLDVNCLSI